MPRHYLDHASTSPLRQAALDAMVEWWRTPAGDPGRIHHEGMTARVALEQAREVVATGFGARAREVVFCSGATEAIHTAVAAASRRGRHAVVPSVEHSAVRLASARHADEVTTVGVDPLGRVDPDEVVAAVRDDTAVVHLQWANHEVGTRQPVEAVVAACRERGVLTHVDAAQTGVGPLPDFASLGADLMSVSAHKLGGPTGVGALLVRRGLRIDPLLVGGDQERARRAGHEHVAGVIGFAAALADLDPDRPSVAWAQTDAIVAAATAIDGVHRYGDPVHRAPHIACFGIDGIEPQAVLLGLDRRGVAAHSGSACASESLEPSPVLEAMGVDAHRSLRVSVGWTTTDADVVAFAEALPEVVGELRRLGRRSQGAGATS